jgi:hypothetical protein
MQPTQILRSTFVSDVKPTPLSPTVRLRLAVYTLLYVLGAID